MNFNKDRPLYPFTISHNNQDDSHAFGYYQFKFDSKEKKANKYHFAGYASVFNIIDSQNDIILPGAFRDIEKNREYILLWQHNPSEPIGKITYLKENKNGLYIRGELSLGISKAYDVYHMLKDQILDSMSIGYTAIDYDFQEKPNHHEVRVIKKLYLWEVSLVTFPANKNAKINAQNHSAHLISECGKKNISSYKKLINSLDQTIEILS